MLNFDITPAVRNLLLANLFLFLAQQYIPGLPLTEWGSLYPIGSPYFYPWQFVTYMFLHANWGHIFGNMIWLIIYGPLLEHRWGGAAVFNLLVDLWGWRGRFLRGSKILRTSPHGAGSQHIPSAAYWRSLR